LNDKYSRDDALMTHKHLMTQRQRTRYDTLANRLRREAGQSLAKKYSSPSKDVEALELRRVSSVDPNHYRRLQQGTSSAANKS
jgi:hypothetical protein